MTPKYLDTLAKRQPAGASCRSNLVSSSHRLYDERLPPDDTTTDSSYTDNEHESVTEDLSPTPGSFEQRPQLSGHDTLWSHSYSFGHDSHIHQRTLHQATQSALTHQIHCAHQDEYGLTREKTPSRYMTDPEYIAGNGNEMHYDAVRANHIPQEPDFVWNEYGISPTHGAAGAGYTSLGQVRSTYTDATAPATYSSGQDYVSVRGSHRELCYEADHTIDGVHSEGIVSTGPSSSGAVDNTEYRWNHASQTVSACAFGQSGYIDAMYTQSTFEKSFSNTPVQADRVDMSLVRSPQSYLPTNYPPALDQTRADVYAHDLHVTKSYNQRYPARNVTNGGMADGYKRTMAPTALGPGTGTDTFTSPPDIRSGCQSLVCTVPHQAQGGPGNFRCKCGRPFTSRYNLTRHVDSKMVAHLKERHREHLCPNCNYGGLLSDDSGSVSCPYRCPGPGCGRCFKTRKDLLAHMERCAAISADTMSP